MTYEQNHINRHDNGEKKKVVAFTAETLEIEEESGENNDEGMTHINRRVTQMTRQRRQRPQQDFRIEKFKWNDDRCYYCGEPGHIKQNYPKHRRPNKINEDPKSLGA